MAADVIGILNGAETTNESGKPTIGLITRDLLGGCCPPDSKELDLDMQVPSGWEKRLDLKSGKVYIHRCEFPNSSAYSVHKKEKRGAIFSAPQDLNLPPTAKPASMSLFDESNLELKLVSSSSAAASPASSSNYQSVCTLDKVKSALERAEKETIRKRSMSVSKSSSPPSNSSSSIKDSAVDDEERSAAGASFAAGCPNCLLYVLVLISNPRCPRCSTTIPLPTVAKKPRIDLNISI